MGQKPVCLIKPISVVCHRTNTSCFLPEAAGIFLSQRLFKKVIYIWGFLELHLDKYVHYIYYFSIKI